MQLQVGAREGSLSHLTHLAERLRIRTPLLAGTDDDIHEAAVVLQPLLRTSGRLLLLLPFLHLWCLPTHLASTSERAVHLT